MIKTLLNYPLSASNSTQKFSVIADFLNPGAPGSSRPSTLSWSFFRFGPLEYDYVSSVSLKSFPHFRSNSRILVDRVTMICHPDPPRRNSAPMCFRLDAPECIAVGEWAFPEFR